MLLILDDKRKSKALALHQMSLRNFHTLTSLMFIDLLAGSGHGALMILPRTCPSDSKKVSI